MTTVVLHNICDCLVKKKRMKRIVTLLLALGILTVTSPIAVATLTEEMRRDGWVSIFNGRTLDGWRTNGAPTGFRVEDGKIIGYGDRNHLFYMEEFRNFELKIDIKISSGGNSGVFVKSQWQIPDSPRDSPRTGFEVQVNSSHSDIRRTGSLINIINIYEALHKDDEWFTMHIICRGNTIRVQINDKVLYTYRCPMEATPRPSRITEQNKRISQGGFIALQQHHQGSHVEFRNIFVRRLPN